MIQILILTALYYSSPSLSANLTYNVRSYGAKPDGVSDCTRAFLSAWGAACAAPAPATIYVPRGRYLLRNAYFGGDVCKNSAITIRIDHGILVAPSDYNVLGNSGNWLRFKSDTGVSIYGGILDGQGKALWDCKNSGKRCPIGAASLAFIDCNNIRIIGLASLNSQMFHIVVDRCQNAKLVNVKILAPANSPNTDGIHVEQSSEVSIMYSHISTGDDCVSIGPGVSHLLIENVDCGPGHGISIGSLGWGMREAGVQNVTVRKVAFTGTQNGVRVKTWARPSHGFVRDIHFQHITMVNVNNAIIIDQNYCPNTLNCPHKDSGVKVSGVKYQDIHGTSATEVAVKFECSKTQPCSGITLSGVNLSYTGRAATAICANAQGVAKGLVTPTSCLATKI